MIIFILDIQPASPNKENTESYAIRGTHKRLGTGRSQRVRCPSSTTHGVAGLGGVFRGKIWMPPAVPKFPSQRDLLSTCSRGERWRDSIPRKHHVSIFWQQYQALRSQRADILITHEAPSSHRYGFKALDELAMAMGVKTIFHGHHHEHYSATIGNGIIVHGVGEAGVVDEEGRVLIVGKEGARG